MRNAMKLSAPMTITWVIAVILGVLGILIHLGVLPLRLGFDHFWLVAGGFVLLALATLLKRL